MDTTSSILKGVMCEGEPDALEDTQEKSIEKLDDDIEKYLERYENILDDNDDTLTRATERSIKSLTSTNNSWIANPILWQIHLISWSQAKVHWERIQPAGSED